MGEVMRLFEARSSRADMPAETDTLATILSVTKYWESAITQIGTCQIGLPDFVKGTAQYRAGQPGEKVARPEIDIGRTQNKTRFV